MTSNEARHYVIKAALIPALVQAYGYAVEPTASELAWEVMRRYEAARQSGLAWFHTQDIVEDEGQEAAA
jgi:hypothetical protein